MRYRPTWSAALVTLLVAACGGAQPESAAHPTPLVHRFTDPARWTKEFDDPARDAWQKPADVVASMHIAPGMTVADVGAGTGYFEPYLSRAVGPGGVVLAVDIEPEMVRWLGDRGVNVERVEELVRTGAPVIGTACPFCQTMFRDALGVVTEAPPKLLDIAQLAAASLPREPQSSS